MKRLTTGDTIGSCTIGNPIGIAEFFILINENSQKHEKYINAQPLPNDKASKIKRNNLREWAEWEKSFGIAKKDECEYLLINSLLLERLAESKNLAQSLYEDMFTDKFHSCIRCIIEILDVAINSPNIVPHYVGLHPQTILVDENLNALVLPEALGLSFGGIPSTLPVDMLIYHSPEEYSRGYRTLEDCLYSLALVLYEMITGDRKSLRIRVQSMLENHPYLNQVQISDKDKEAIKQANGSLGTETIDTLNIVFKRALSHRSKERYSTPKEFRKALTSILNNNTKEVKKIMPTNWRERCLAEIEFLVNTHKKLPEIFKILLAILILLTLMVSVWFGIFSHSKTIEINKILNNKQELEIKINELEGNNRKLENDLSAERNKLEEARKNSDITVAVSQLKSTISELKEKIDHGMEKIWQPMNTLEMQILKNTMETTVHKTRDARAKLQDMIKSFPAKEEKLKAKSEEMSREITQADEAENKDKAKYNSLCKMRIKREIAFSDAIRNKVEAINNAYNNGSGGIKEKLDKLDQDYRAANNISDVSLDAKQKYSEVINDAEMINEKFDDVEKEINGLVDKLQEKRRKLYNDLIGEWASASAKPLPCHSGEIRVSFIGEKYSNKWEMEKMQVVWLKEGFTENEIYIIPYQSTNPANVGTDEPVMEPTENESELSMDGVKLYTAGNDKDRAQKIHRWQYDISTNKRLQMYLENENKLLKTYQKCR